MSGGRAAAAAAAARGQADVLTLPRLMRGLPYRSETPNADRDPIRYQWHTRPFPEEKYHATGNDIIGSGSDFGHHHHDHHHHHQGVGGVGGKPGGAGRLDSDDILDAVRRRIRSPPDHQVRDSMHRRALAAAAASSGGGAGSGGGQLNSVMAHYLTASSLADSVLNHRLMQPQPAGCRCCADVNYVNKMRRHRAARGVVPLPEQDRLGGPPSSFHYGASPDELAALEDHRRLRAMTTQPPELQRSEAEHRLEANLQRLQYSIQALGEPPELPGVPAVCSVRDELEPAADEYFRPGVVPTKYLPFAPKNPLRHPPPQLDRDAYRDRRRPGRAKYVSFSPRNPELMVYSPDGSVLYRD